MAVTRAAVSGSRKPSVSTTPEEMSCHSWPWLSPSKLTVPIITAAKATVPGSALEVGSPPSGRRTPTTPSRVSKIDRRAKRLK